MAYELRENSEGHQYNQDLTPREMNYHPDNRGMLMLLSRFYDQSIEREQNEKAMNLLNSIIRVSFNEIHLRHCGWTCEKIPSFNKVGRRIGYGVKYHEPK